MVSDRTRLQLRDLCTSIDYGLTASATVEQKGPKFLRITDIVRGGINWNEVPFVDLAGSNPQEEKYALRSGDIVIARTGATTGYSACVLDPPEAVFASYLVRFTVSEDHNPRFVGYLLKGPQWWNYIDGVLGDKSAQPNASANTLADAWFDVPDRPTQDAIVAVLGSIDDKIETNKRIVQLNEELATRLLDQAPNRIPLGKLATVQRTAIDPATSGATLVDHFSLPAFDESGLPLRQAGAEIKSGKLRIDTVSVLVSRLNPQTPRVWYAVPKLGVLSVASTEFVVMTPLNGSTPEELWACCNTAGFSSALVESVTGTTGSHQRVQAVDVLATKVGDPRSVSDEQRLAINDMVQSAFFFRKESESLAIVRDTMLPKLLNGEIRVRDPKPLERITE